jgi:tetratricopeptide (TPR) repeat protein
MLTATLTKNRLFAVLCLALALVTLALYWPITRNGFVNFDDDQYVVGNMHVTTGLTWTNVVWAFKTGEAANWHPLTWISHMIDCDLYGLNPGGHHLTNLLFHVANTLLLFLLLNQMTGAMWRSTFVAAFFAWHPLHVESVAWASERKDTLSTFFWLLTLLAYVRYAKEQGARSKEQNGVRRNPFFLLLSSCFGFYSAALIFFALALMSKAMAVTLPFVLLLLDFWPLNRICLPDFAAESNPERAQPPPAKSWTRTALFLVVEKIPFFALALAASIVTFLIQKTAGAVWASSWELRLENVVLAYVRYISKLFWPENLAIVYSFPRHWPALLAAGAALLLLTWTALSLYRARQNPYLPVGWFWFIGTLVPTIGIVQVGAQSIADRYTYIPSIGFFIVVVWGAHDLAKRWPERGKFLALAGIVALVGCLGVTSIQIGYWHDSERLFLHAIEVTTDNYVAENCLGKAFEKTGRNDRALVLYANAVKIEPRYPQSQFNLALCLLVFGKTNEALEHLRIAARLQPHDPDIQYDLGVYFSQHGSPSDAALGFQSALADRPDFPEAQTALGSLLSRQRKFAEAIPHFAATVRLKPEDPEARFNLGLALLDNHQPAEAAAQFSEELRLTPNATKAHYRLALALQQQNKLAEAVIHYRAALHFTPDFPEAKAALDMLVAAHPELKTSEPLDTAR